MSFTSVLASTLLLLAVSKQRGFGPFFNMRYLILLSLLTGCSAPLMLGAGMASTATVATTGSSPTDIALSRARDQDCQTIRFLKGESVCRDIPQDNTGINAMERAFAKRQQSN